jgi:hypothetical protein
MEWSVLREPEGSVGGVVACQIVLILNIRFKSF